MTAFGIVVADVLGQVIDGFAARGIVPIMHAPTLSVPLADSIRALS